MPLNGETPPAGVGPLFAILRARYLEDAQLRISSSSSVRSESNRKNQPKARMETYMIEDRISVEERGHVRIVRLSRPDKLNALDLPMFRALMKVGEQLREDPSARAVVLCGEGKAFCAGLDFAGFMSLGNDKDADLLAEGSSPEVTRAQSAAHVFTTLPVPVIAAIHGYAFGGGLQIALGADVRIVHPEAQLSVMEIKWGLVPDMTGTQTLRHLVPQDVAKELTFTGRRLSGEEAVRLGLATRTADDPLAAAIELADEIATKSPDAIRAGKTLLSRAYTAEPAEGLRIEADIQKTLIGKPNQLEAVRANMEKRPPEFADPE